MFKWHAIKICAFNILFQEGSDNEEEEGEEEEEENTDYLTDSNKENETDEENTVCISFWLMKLLLHGQFFSTEYF